MAVAGGFREICVALIQHGAKINIKDKLGNTPVHYVNKRGILKLLILHHSTLLVGNNAGLTPLQYYLKSNNELERDLKFVAFLTECYDEERRAKFSDDVSSLNSIYSQRPHLIKR